MDQQRSPRYPSVSLSDAITATRSLWTKEKRTAVVGDVLAKAIGYKSNSGPARSLIGAMRQYGLLEKHGNGLRLSEVAMQILHSADGSPDQVSAIREAALTPELFRDLDTTHADASEDAITSYLILRRGFSDGGARLAASAYKDTLSLAKPIDKGYTSKREGREEPPPPAALRKVGDFVQWESQGVLQFLEPKRVREISDDGNWAFVDGSNTGVPVKELTVVADKLDSQNQMGVAPPRPRTMVEAQQASGQVPAIPVGRMQDVFSLAEGPVTIQWPASLSAESYEDFSGWLDLLKRKIGRSVAKIEPKP
jgi:hypothetical protein